MTEIVTSSQSSVRLLLGLLLLLIALLAVVYEDFLYIQYLHPSHRIILNTIRNSTQRHLDFASEEKKEGDLKVVLLQPTEILPALSGNVQWIVTFNDTKSICKSTNCFYTTYLHLDGTLVKTMSSEFEQHSSVKEVITLSCTVYASN